MIEATITLVEARRAVALIEAAHAKGYIASVAVLTLITGGRSISDCVLVTDGLYVNAGHKDGRHDYGRQPSAEYVVPLKTSET